MIRPKWPASPAACPALCDESRAVSQREPWQPSVTDLEPTRNLAHIIDMTERDATVFRV